MFVGSGINRGEEAIPAAANRINFAPRIGAPKLLLQGRYDESDPLTSEAEPLFALWREPKRLEVFEGGHVPQPDVMFQATTRFFDETLGPVAR
jgi:pimeloyl-ACP methyl ester carboxylesterase